MTIGRIPWNKGLKTGIVPKSAFKKGKPSIEFAKKRDENRPRGERAYQWKGEDVGYRDIHHWIEKQLGKPMRCQDCKDSTRSRYHWANVSGEYKRDIIDWKRLCVPCHMKLDKERRNILLTKTQES